MKKTIIESLLDESASAIRVIEQNPDIKLKDTTLAVAQKSHKTLSKVDTETIRLEAELAVKIQERNAAVKELRTFVSRVRSGVRCYCGPDSPEMGLLGLTRASDRKSPTRRAKSNGVTNPNGNGNGTATANGNGDGNGNGAAADQVQN